VADVLSAIDCLVLPSLMEGLPLTVAEALSVGRPVIATRVAGTPEIVSTPEVGWLVAPSDVNALRGALHAMAGLSADQVYAMRTAARLHATTHFDASAAYEQIVKLMERL
jgi:glycosyltransferase involved in cell wall biosynthesis